MKCKGRREWGGGGGKKSAEMGSESEDLNCQWDTSEKREERGCEFSSVQFRLRICRSNQSRKSSSAEFLSNILYSMSKHYEQTGLVLYLFDFYLPLIQSLLGYIGIYFPIYPQWTLHTQYIHKYTGPDPNTNHISLFITSECVNTNPPISLSFLRGQHEPQLHTLS